MCPAATESKSSNPSSKKKINKKIDSNFKNDREEESIKYQDPIQNSKQKPLNDEGSIESNDEFASKFQKNFINAPNFIDI